MNNLTNTKMSGLDRTIKVEGIAQLLRLFTGERPIIEGYADYTDIGFTQGQRAQIEELLNRWYDAKPGEIRIDIKSVLLPFFLKKFTLWIALIAVGTLIAGFVLAKATGK